MDGARAEEGRLGLLAARRGASAGRRARRREWQLVVVVVAAAAMAAMEGAAMAVVVAVVAAERQRLPLGGCQDGSDGPWGVQQPKVWPWPQIQGSEFTVHRLTEGVQSTFCVIPPRGAAPRPNLMRTAVHPFYKTLNRSADFYSLFIY